MLRVDANCLAIGNSEEFGVEKVDVIEKAAPFGRHLHGCFRVGVIILIDVPAIAGNLTDGINSVCEQLPEIGECVGAAGKTARHPDDRDWCP